AGKHAAPHLAGFVDPESTADALLPVLRARHVRPSVDTERGGLHRLPDVDVRMTCDEHMCGERLPGQIGDDARLLRSRHEVVDEDADLAVLGWGERTQPIVEFVDPVHGFDHDALDAQVVTPDALDEGGVMHTFDPDPAATGSPRWRMRHGE